jgi:hypothetical protein
MPGPLATSLLISGGSSLAGFAADKLFNSGPDVPNLRAEAAAKFDNARRELQDQTDENIDQVQADAAASGADPLGPMADVIDSNNEAMADLGAKEAQSLARASNQMERMKFKKEQRQSQATSQGIGSVVNAVSQAGSAYAMGDLSFGGGDESLFGPKMQFDMQSFANLPASSSGGAPSGGENFDNPIFGSMEFYDKQNG